MVTGHGHALTYKQTGLFMLRSVALGYDRQRVSRLIDGVLGPGHTRHITGTMKDRPTFLICRAKCDKADLTAEEHLASDTQAVIKDWHLFRLLCTTFALH